MKCDFVEMVKDKQVHCDLDAESYYRGGYVQMGQSKAKFCRKHGQYLLSPEVIANGRIWEWDSLISKQRNLERGP